MLIKTLPRFCVHTKKIRNRSFSLKHAKEKEKTKIREICLLLSFVAIVDSSLSLSLAHKRYVIHEKKKETSLSSCCSVFLLNLQTTNVLRSRQIRIKLTDRHRNRFSSHHWSINRTPMTLDNAMNRNLVRHDHSKQQVMKTIIERITDFDHNLLNKKERKRDVVPINELCWWHD